MIRWRIFFNITSGTEFPWCIDTGHGTERMWVKDVSVEMECPVYFKTAPATHPKAWIETVAELHIKDNKARFINPNFPIAESKTHSVHAEDHAATA